MNTNMGVVVGMLGVLFVGLKLTDNIDWSWWLVTLPFWIGIPIALLVWIVTIILIVGARRK